MAHRHAHAGGIEPGDELERTRQLRRDGDDPERFEQRGEVFARHFLRRAQVRRVVRAAPRIGEERPFEVETERLGAIVGRVRHPRAHVVREVAQFRQRRGHGSGQERGDAAAQQRPRHTVQGGAVAHRRVAAPTMDVHVHETRAQVRGIRFGGRIGGQRHIGDQPVLDRERTRDDLVFEDESAGYSLAHAAAISAISAP